MIQELHKYAGISLYICNDELYGYIMVPLGKDETIKEDLQRLTNIKLEILCMSKLLIYFLYYVYCLYICYIFFYVKMILAEDHLMLSSSMEKFMSLPNLDKLGLDNIYMINLLRRPERRTRMFRLLNELGVHVETFNAVDGR